MEASPGSLSTLAMRSSRRFVDDDERGQGGGACGLSDGLHGVVCFEFQGSEL